MFFSNTPLEINEVAGDMPVLVIKGNESPRIPSNLLKKDNISDFIVI